MLFTLNEIFDLVIMTLAVGFIFFNTFKEYAPRPKKYDPLKAAMRKGFDWNAYFFVVLVTAPAIILHEMGHKFVALGFGLHAVFHAAYTWLGIGVVLKLLNFPFIFFVPGFVEIFGISSYLQSVLISFAGPGVNLVLWLGAAALLRFKLVQGKKYLAFLVLTSKINMFLFIFNMIPLPFFDGWAIYSGIFHIFF